MRTAHRTLAALLVAALATAACRTGEPPVRGGLPEDTPVDQTIEVGMADLAFEPEAISLKPGTTVRFVFHNEGRLPHQALFGDEAAQEAYAAGTGTRIGVEVGPGGSKSFIRRFDAPARLIIGCHIPGHYQAGMKARLIVE